MKQETTGVTRSDSHLKRTSLSAMLKTDGKGLAVEGRNTQKANGLYEDKGDNGLCHCDSRSDAK